MNFEKGVGKSVFLGKKDFKIYKEIFTPVAYTLGVTPLDTVLGTSVLTSPRFHLKHSFK